MICVKIKFHNSIRRFLLQTSVDPRGNGCKDTTNNNGDNELPNAPAGHCGRPNTTRPQTRQYATQYQKIRTSPTPWGATRSMHENETKCAYTSSADLDSRGIGIGNMLRCKILAFVQRTLAGVAAQNGRVFNEHLGFRHIKRREMPLLID